MILTGVRSLLHLLLLASLASNADASRFGGIREGTLYPFAQQFTWEEFESGGKRILVERGVQYGVGGNVKLGLLEGSAGALTLSSRTEISGGIVDYTGATQADGEHPTTSNRPVGTDVHYLGFTEELDLGWAIPIRQSIFEPFAGCIYRRWMRDLQHSSSVDTEGAVFAVSGYTENWVSLSALLGFKSRYTLSKEAAFSVTGAAKYPFYNRNSVEYPGSGDLSLKPGSEWSALSDVTFEYKSLIASLFYENFIFPASPVVRVYNSVEQGDVLLMQPRSESRIIGLRIGWSFL